MAYFGQAYDLRAAPYKLIENRVKRTGDGTHPVFVSTKVSWDDKKNVSPEEAEQNYEKEKRHIVDTFTRSQRLLSNRTAVVQG